MKSSTVNRIEDLKDLSNFTVIPYHGPYRIARDGRVLGRKGNRILKKQIRGGYAMVSMDSQLIPVARLLCETYIGPRPTRNAVVIHLKGPASCHIDDVRWGTRSESRTI